MSLGFNIEKAFYQTFGLPLETEFKIDKRNVNPQKETNSQFKIPNAVAQSDSAKLGSKFFATDVHGRYYFLPVTIYYNDIQTHKDFSYDLPFPVIGTDAGKDIIETSLVERNGSVKEIINTNDIIISIKGFIVDPNNNYPEDDVRELFETVFLPNQTVKIRSALTDIFLKDNEFSVVVKKLRFPPVTGVIGAKPYEIDLVSDAIFDLEKVPA